MNHHNSSPKSSLHEAQSVTDTGGITCLNIGSLLHGHVEHTNHVHCNHPGPDLVVFFSFARLFEFFPFGVVSVLLRWDLIYKLFDYSHTNFCASL